MRSGRCSRRLAALLTTAVWPLASLIVTVTGNEPDGLEVTYVNVPVTVNTPFGSGPFTLPSVVWPSPQSMTACGFVADRSAAGLVSVNVATTTLFNAMPGVTGTSSRSP